MNDPAQPMLAVVTPNILMGLGMRTLLEGLLPQADVAVFHRFGDLEAADTGQFAHYFVSVPVSVQHSAFFRRQRHKTILLGRGSHVQFEDMPRLDIYGGEEKLVRDLLLLHRGAHPAGHGSAPTHPSVPTLTPRETEVLALVAQGLLNKQIAQRLHIGTTTVISHRRNIMEKLGIKSVAGLTLYAAALGCVDADEL